VRYTIETLVLIGNWGGGNIWSICLTLSLTSIYPPTNFSILNLKRQIIIKIIKIEPMFFYFDSNITSLKLAQFKTWILKHNEISWFILKSNETTLKFH
jgi:hypothetical protein